MPSVAAPGDDFSHGSAINRLLTVLMEAIVLAMVCLSPWALGAAEPVFEYILYAGVAMLLCLWALRILIEWRFTWKKCPISLCLAGLCLVGIAQLVPLPQEWAERLSPAAVRLIEQLVPAQPEVLRDEAPAASAIIAAEPRLTLYPAATRRTVLQFLAVLALFGVVRHNLATPAAFRRLGLAALCNGAALSLFALLQVVSSHPNQMYWTYALPGRVFGPFVCRNHFPFYVNLCIGLGLGLLMSPRYRGHRTSLPFSGGSWAGSWKDRLSAPFDLLQQPKLMWMGAAISLMIAAVVCSLSRGGVVAFLGGAAVALFLKLLHSRRFSGLEMGLFILAPTLALISWFGFDRVEDRLATLWQGETLQQGRVLLWQRGLAIARDHFWSGTGYGTFQYVEPIYRTSTAEESVYFEHAHNEYLEALAEGGPARLLLSLGAIFLVYVLGFRALRRHRDRTAGTLALGGLFAISTAVIHSFFDFGLHIPAVMTLATVISAHLATLGMSDPGRDRPEAASQFHFSGAGPLLAAVSLVALALVLVGEGWRGDRVYRLRLAAAMLFQEQGRHDRGIALLEKAIQLAPDAARLHEQAGQAYVDSYESRAAELEKRHVRMSAPPSVLISAAIAAAPAAGTVLAVPPAWIMMREISRAEAANSKRTLLNPGLRHFIHARSLNPLLPRTHLQLASYAGAMERSDGRAAYLARAKLLAPADSRLWYFFGLQELLDGRPADACSSWRQSLHLSDRHFTDILRRSAVLFPPQIIRDKVLPDKPAMLWRAADFLYPDSKQLDRRRPFYKKSLALLEKQGERRSAEDWYVKGVIHQSFGQASEAAAAFQEALMRSPSQPEWRLQYAYVLLGQGRRDDARRELHIVMSQHPNHEAAQELLKKIAAEEL